MRCFLVYRTDEPTWCEDISAVVIAEDERHAERRARWGSMDFKKKPLKVQEIDMTEEQVVLVNNMGS